MLSRLTCDSSYLPLKQSPHETSDVCPKTDPDEVERLQFASMFLLDKTTAIWTMFIHIHLTDTTMQLENFYQQI